MKRRVQQQVSPTVTAAVILIVLVVIQVLWWRGLVMKPKPGPPPGPMRGGGGPVIGPPTLIGREDVRVETLSGAPEPGNDDGPGHHARFDSPVGLALDSQGNLYVADSRNHRIRRITPTGTTTTLAGSGPGYADGPALQAQFNLPCGVAVGLDGEVYVADTGNDRIRRIKDGQVTTLAGSVPGLADGEGAAAKFHAPVAVTYLAGYVPSLLIADTLNRRVRILYLPGTVTGGPGMVTGGWAVPGTPTGLAGVTFAVAVPQAGVWLPSEKMLRNIPIDIADLSANASDFALRHPVALCPAPNGWFVTDADHCGVFSVQNGKAELLAGRCQAHSRVSGWRDTTGNRAFFGQVSGIVADGHGHLYVSDTGNNAIRRVTLPE